MKNSEDVKKRIKAIIVEHLDVPPEKVTDEATFAENLGADSLDAMDLLMAINEEFEINIPAEKLDEIYTVQDMVAQVEKLLKK